MRILARILPLFCCISCAVLIPSKVCVAQDQPVSHVIIPNPTPRDPDLEKVYDEAQTDKDKQHTISIQNQLRAREIWLESNKILLLAQQLQQEILSNKKTVSMQTNAARAGQIAKLAKSVQEGMKAR